MSFLPGSLNENIITSNKLLLKPLLVFDPTDGAGETENSRRQGFLNFTVLIK